MVLMSMSVTVQPRFPPVCLNTPIPDPPLENANNAVWTTNAQCGNACNRNTCRQQEQDKLKLREAIDKSADPLCIEIRLFCVLSCVQRRERYKHPLSHVLLVLELKFVYPVPGSDRYI